MQTIMQFNVTKLNNHRAKHTSYVQADDRQHAVCALHWP